MTIDKRKVLGRGLETLLPARQVPHAPVGSAPAAAKSDADKVLHIPITELDHNPYQTRTIDPSSIGELAASIKAVGVLQPIVVRPVAGGRYQVIAGERRWEASRSLGLPTIPAMVRQVSNEQAMEMTIIENLQREDLNPMEQARAFERLGREFGLTQEQMALRTGKERATITNFLRLLKLPGYTQGLLERNLITLGHCKVLLALEEGKRIDDLARRITEHGLSVRETEVAVSHLLQPLQPKAKKQRIIDPNVRAAENMLQQALGLRVTIDDHKGRGGKILIEYSTLEDFDRVVAALSGQPDYKRFGNADVKAEVGSEQPG
ncbi:MAG TPA: ParB/RepB/Spo0J family partition protein [Terriglobales bacterium]|nr:ParB/RepB/Spo0J family partition protein [Terriglobales bacterium]